MIAKPKGTYDLYGSESRNVLFLQNLIQNLMENYNYEMIRTPLFESSDLFHRGVGETTDIVTKETYDFKDRGERNLTLRPEGTAGAARCFIENKLYAENMPKKFWYYGPMYRYERPQAGRFREHYQFGCEVYGSFDPIIDAEVISIPYTLFKSLGLNVKVHINSLGDKESRDSYHDALIEYLRPNINDLCEDCKERFEKNPLRILDCKVDRDSDILLNVPKTIDYLNEESKEYFDKVLKYLDALEVDYVVDPKTVRGLDYYTHTVFEIECVDIENRNSVLCGGGRYNNLIKNLGGPEVPAVGFGMGTERLLQVLDDTGLGFNLGSYLDCYIIPVSENEKVEALTLCYALRMMGFKVDIDNMNRNVKNNFKQAEKLNAKFAIVVGEEELKEGYFTVKDMKNKSSDEVNTSLIVNYLMEKLTEEEDCSCMDDCCCDDDCDCSCECDCGDDCNCDEHHKCNDNCTCGDDCCCNDECDCGDDCHCHDDDRCSEDCKCHKHND